MIVTVVIMSVKKSGERHKGKFTERITRGGAQRKPFTQLKAYILGASLGLTLLFFYVR